jgi:hypothetical protein
MHWWRKRQVMATELVVHDFEDLPVTRADIEEAIRGHALTASRLPRHYTDRRGAIHARINSLLDQWENTPS